MDMQNMVTLPPKYLKPIYMNVGSTDFQTTTTTTTTTDFTAGMTSTQDYQFQTSTDYQMPTTDYTPTTDFAATATATTTDYTTSTDFGATDFSASYSQPTYSATESTFQTTSTTGIPAGFKLIRRGSGITLNEQNSIVGVASQILQSGITPVSNNTAKGVKKKLGGDWLVIVYPHGKTIDFNMTCVQGNDYLYFVIDTTAFQVCRLK